jgi:16S rRNA (uracil1498-N3)-methyltransferase
MRDTEHHLFYSRDIADDLIMLDESETNHAISVLRIKEGERVYITDGKGTIFECKCDALAKRTISCTISSKTIIPKIVPELTLLIGNP